jgi:signal transduction histidine kinase
MARVLLVDDELRNLRLLESLLEPLGLELHTATDGRTALSRIEELSPDLVLLDLVMPGLDGIDVLTHLRASGKEHVPVIVVTAHSERAHRLRALSAGADEFLEKPIDSALLHVRVRTLLALKQSRDELANRHAALVALQREQRELMQFIMHDLRSPLMVVKAGVEFAGENLKVDPVESRAALQDAADSLIRVNDLVGDLLAVSRLEEANRPLLVEELRVDQLVTRIREQYSRKAHAQGILMETHADALVIRANAALLHRVLQNILDNSLRHTPRTGRMSIDVERDPRRKLTITVSNSGPPIPPEERESVFEKFVRGRSPNSRHGAVGIGLYFCKRAIEAHGGRIRVDETPVWPTRFIIELPVN